MPSTVAADEMSDIKMTLELSANSTSTTAKMPKDGAAAEADGVQVSQSGEPPAKQEGWRLEQCTAWADLVGPFVDDYANGTDDWENAVTSVSVAEGTQDTLWTIIPFQNADVSNDVEQELSVWNQSYASETMEREGDEFHDGVTDSQVKYTSSADMEIPLEENWKSAAEDGTSYGGESGLEKTTSRLTEMSGGNAAEHSTAVLDGETKNQDDLQFYSRDFTADSAAAAKRADQRREQSIHLYSLGGATVTSSSDQSRSTSVESADSVQSQTSSSSSDLHFATGKSYTSTQEKLVSASAIDATDDVSIYLENVSRGETGTWKNGVDSSVGLTQPSLGRDRGAATSRHNDDDASGDDGNPSGDDDWFFDNEYRVARDEILSTESNEVLPDYDLERSIEADSDVSNEYSKFISPFSVFVSSAVEDNAIFGGLSLGNERDAAAVTVNSSQVFVAPTTDTYTNQTYHRYSDDVTQEIDQIADSGQHSVLSTSVYGSFTSDDADKTELVTEAGFDFVTPTVERTQSSNIVSQGNVHVVTERHPKVEPLTAMTESGNVVRDSSGFETNSPTIRHAVADSDEMPIYDLAPGWFVMSATRRSPSYVMPIADGTPRPIIRRVADTQKPHIPTPNSSMASGIEVPTGSMINIRR